MTTNLKRVLTVVAAVGLVTLGLGAAALATPPQGGPPGQGDCSHGNTGKDCRPDPQPGHGQDCDEHGPKNGGVNEDHCLPGETTPTDTTPTETTPTETTPTETTPTTPTPTTPTHGCTFVGADKDGGHDASGGTNDDCAPRPVDPVVPKTETGATAVVTPATTTTTATVTVPPVKVVVKVKPKPKPVRKPAAKTPKPDNPPVKKVGHVCKSLADGTPRRWYKGGNGIKPGCYAVVQGSG